jgi:integrase
MRTIQEWMGHRDFKTTLIYADYAPSAHELDLVNSAWSKSTDPVVYQTVYQPRATQST